MRVVPANSVTCVALMVYAGSVVLAESLMLQSGRAGAEVISTAAGGFEIRETAHVAASPDKAYAAMIQPSRWWSSDHSFSGNASNLTLDAHAGGCWCESLPDGGSVELLHVVYAAPGKMLKLRGALGPLQSMSVEGVMIWSVKPAAEGTDITLSYSVVGYAKDGLEVMSKPVDHVLGEQLERLKKFIDG